MCEINPPKKREILVENPLKEQKKKVVIVLMNIERA